MDADPHIAKNCNALHDAKNDIQQSAATIAIMQYQLLPNEHLIIIVGHALKLPTSRCKPAYRWSLYMGSSYFLSDLEDRDEGDGRLIIL